MSEITRSQTTETPVPQTRETPALRPTVDIFETKDGLGVVVDLPGATKEDVDVRVENDILTIQSKAHPARTGSILYQEFEVGPFFRQFQLTDHVDQAKIKAEMKHGVLTLHLPKAEKAKPKKITVNVTS